MLKKNLLKKTVAVTLSLAMTITMANFGTVIGPAAKGMTDVMAEEVAEDVAEPAYDVATDQVLFYNATKTVEKGQSWDLGTEIPQGEEFCLSFFVKMDNASEGTDLIYANFLNAATGGRFMLAREYCEISNTTPDWKRLAGDCGVTTDGAKITIKTDGTTAKIWVNESLF